MGTGKRRLWSCYSGSWRKGWYTPATAAGLTDKYRTGVTAVTDYSSFVCSAVGNYQNMRGWWLRWERRFLGRTLRLCTLLLNVTEGLNLKTNEICRPCVTPADKFNPKTTTNGVILILGMFLPEMCPFGDS